MRVIKILGLSLLVLLLLVILLVLGLLNFGPVSIPTVALRDAFGFNIETPAESIVAQRLQVPAGFSIGQYATGLKKVRVLIFSDAGDLLVSQPNEGKVLLLQRDNNADGQHDGQQVLLEQLNGPHGLAFYQQFLYVAEADAVGRVPFDHASGQITGDYQQIITGLPGAVAHWPKSLLIKDDKLYVNIGSSCNVCEEADERQATIMQFDTDGQHGRIFASGLRNSVGFDVAPWDGALYATDNGRDLLGDDYPVCELNKIVDGGFYGWPYINGFGDLDPDYGAGKEALLQTAISPVFGFRPHNAPLGIEFLDKATMPAGYERSALVALHGSWNRREPDGYKVISLHWQEDGSITAEDFLTGFELAGDVIGRPVDIEEGPDGCVYISEDYAGTIYRVCHGIEQKALQDSQSTVSTDHYLQQLSDEQLQAASERGKFLFHRHGCLGCHQLNNLGADDGKALSALHERYTSESLAAYFLKPNPPMPQYFLSEAQRLDLAIFLLQSTR